MKKLIIVLMVVAMASFLFVGCVPTTPVTPVEPVTPVPTVKTDTPYITDVGGITLYSTDTQYATNATTEGIAVAGAIIKLYIDGVQAGVANSGDVGAFTVTVSMLKLTEGVKKLYVTATVPGLAESDPSTEYTFTVDKTAPKIASAIGDSSANFITVTFNEDVETAEEYTGIDEDKEAAWDMSALNPELWVVTLEGATAPEDLVTSDFVATSSKVIRITVGEVGTGGDVFTLSATGIGDSLGNTSTTATTYVGVVSD